MFRVPTVHASVKPRGVTTLEVGNRVLGTDRVTSGRRRGRLVAADGLLGRGGEGSNGSCLGSRGGVRVRIESHRDWISRGIVLYTADDSLVDQPLMISENGVLTHS